MLFDRSLSIFSMKYKEYFHYRCKVQLDLPVVVPRIPPGVEELGHKPGNGITDGGEVDGVLCSVGVVAEVDEVEVGVEG